MRDHHLENAKAETTYYYSGIQDTIGDEGLWDMDLRWPVVEPLLELRPEDEVDIGCAEGLITMEVAQKVKHVRGVKIHPKRVEAAKRIAEQQGINNVSFECDSIVDVSIRNESYDVVMLLGVLHHLHHNEKWAALAKALNGARRHVILRTPLRRHEKPYRAMNFIGVCEQLGFSLTIYPRLVAYGGHMMIAKRFCEPQHERSQDAA